MSPAADELPLTKVQIFGIKYGLRGFCDRVTKPVHLTPEVVEGIQLRGGTILVRLLWDLQVLGVRVLSMLVDAQGPSVASNAAAPPWCPCCRI